jgi:hypothetical protein
VVFGLMGAVVNGILLAVIFKTRHGGAGGAIVFLCLILLMLIVRSILQARAGFLGLRGADHETLAARAADYYNFGVISSMLTAGGLLLLFVFTSGGGGVLEILVLVVLVGYLLSIWPLMLRHFFVERNFGMLLAGEQAPVVRRAPDAGMTALGWLLLATAVTSLGTGLASLVSNPFEGEGMFGLGMAEIGPSGLQRWLPLGLSMIQVWAGIELSTMSARYRLAANSFAAASIAVTAVLHWDLLRNLDKLQPLLGGADGMGGLLAFATVALGLLLPVVALILANRQAIPTARALPPRE